VPGKTGTEGMKLRIAPPPNRTYEQLRRHYLAEKALADRLKLATREERTLLSSCQKPLSPQFWLGQALIS
jgi:hypothetical protein